MSESNHTTVSHETPDSAPGIERPEPVAERKRCRPRMQVDLLKFCENVSRRRTQIVYNVNLNFNILKPYLGDLLTLGFLAHEEPYYWTTEDGSRWAHEIDPLLAEVDE